MALADYFHRSAVAIAQVLDGYDETAIREKLAATCVGLVLPDEDRDGAEQAALIDMSTRLLARLYPQLSIQGGSTARRESVTALARAVNPAIELVDTTPDIALAIGTATPSAATVVHIGSSGWDALVSTEPQPVGDTSIPFGAGAAACLGAANVFRRVFIGADAEIDTDLCLSTLELTTTPTRASATIDGVDLGDSNVLVGLGAVGNACLWALTRTPARGTLHLVDHEAVELSNLQRYVLTTRDDEGTDKTAIATQALATSAIHGEPHTEPWDQFIATHGYHWKRVLVALDSARDRRAVQATLPRWIANAWTQPGDLGLSTHDFIDGACLACLYLPQGEAPSEDKLIADALGIARPERELQIRNLLHDNAPPPDEFIAEVAEQLHVPLELLQPYSQRPLRDLYTEGICGGAIIPLDQLGRPAQHLHVPVAHQSALAGTLLAARLVADALGHSLPAAAVARLDVLRAVPQLIPNLAQAAAKDPRGICICQDDTYVEAYSLKY